MENTLGISFVWYNILININIYYPVYRKNQYHGLLAWLEIEIIAGFIR